MSKKLFENNMNDTSADKVASLNKVIIPIISRGLLPVIAKEIIGFKPMTGPVAW